MEPPPGAAPDSEASEEQQKPQLTHTEIVIQAIHQAAGEELTPVPKNKNRATSHEIR